MSRQHLRLLVVGLLACATTSASAHETRAAGPVRLTIGWATEPAYSGLGNAVEVSVADAAGAPVADPSASLRVGVSFGDVSRVVGLHPATGRPGVFTAPLVPTRAGTYAFHVTGTVRGEAVDVTSTCSPETFDCVVDASEVQFPAKDPPTAHVAERVEREAARLRQARSQAVTAQRISAAAVVVALLALGVSVGRGRRRAG